MNMNTLQINDELLCAYLDDALDETARAQLDAALDADPGARLRLENMRQADSMLRAAMPLKRADGFESMLADRIQVRSPARRSVARVVPWALAASLAGVLAVLVAQRPEAGNGVQGLGTAVAAALDGQRSGVAGEAGVQVLLTFQAADGRYCRLFRTDGAEGSGEGLGCRTADAWQLVAWDATAPESRDGYRTAGASALVDGAMSALGGSPALSAEEEAAVIDGKWRQP